jgi:YidC/Oxa1 family membrane protein insertase
MQNTLRHIVAIALAACGPAIAASAAPAEPLAGNGFAALIDMRSGAIEFWELPRIRGELGGARQLTGSARNVRSTHMRLLGEIAGESVQRPGDIWQSQHVDDRVVLSLLPEGPDFALEMHWAALAEPYRLRLEIRISAQESPLVAEDEQLRVRLGPGIGEVPADGFGVATGMYSFTEAAFHASGRVNRERLGHRSPAFRRDVSAGLVWAGLHSRYFAMVVRPADASSIIALEGRIPSEVNAQGDLGPFFTELDLLLKGFRLEPGETRTFGFEVYGGPKSVDALRAGANSLDDLVFPGLWQWMRWLTLGIMCVLTQIHHVVPSWGIAIVLLAVLVRILMHPIARNAMYHQRRFSEIQAQIGPELDEIRRQYKGGEQSERILAVYERHQVSPLAGLRPLLIVMIQIPIFIALFHLLGQAFELRDAEFLWIDTLAEPDRSIPLGVELAFFGSHLNVLPILMSLTTLLSIRLSPAPSSGGKPARSQNAIMIVVTLAFFVLFYTFPAGMVLYWTAANVLHLLHTIHVRRT